MPGVLVVNGQHPRIVLRPPRAGASLSDGGSGSRGGGEEEDVAPVLGYCLRQARLLPGMSPPLPGRAPALISHGPERLSLAICSPDHRPNRGDKLLMEPQLERARGAGTEGAEVG